MDLTSIETKIVLKLPRISAMMTQQRSRQRGKIRLGYRMPIVKALEIPPLVADKIESWGNDMSMDLFIGSTYLS